VLIIIIRYIIPVDKGKSSRLFTEMADAAIMGYPDSPCDEAAVVQVMTFVEGINDFDEHILEYIFRQASVFYQQHDSRKDPVLVAMHKHSKGTVIAGSVHLYKFFICQVTISFHVIMF
jgi:hypothetical protein